MCLESRWINVEWEKLEIKHLEYIIWTDSIYQQKIGEEMWNF